MNVRCHISDNTFHRVAAVTGARGLIGRYIVERLVAAGWQVRILSRQTRGVEADLRTSLVSADINNTSALHELLDGVSSVFHCAAELHDESQMHTVNVKGTESLLRALKTSSVQYFCHLSSSGVVGAASFHEVDEDTPCYPNNLYEKTKYEAEQIVVHAGLNMDVCILRPTNVFDIHKLGILALPLRHSFKDKLSLLLKGHERAHLIHAKDVAAAALFFIDKALLRPQVFFVSCDSDARNTVAGVYELLRSMCCDNMGCMTFSLPNSVPYMLRKLIRGNSLHGRVCFSNEKLQKTGFVFPLGFYDGLMDVCRAHRSLK